MNPVFTAAHVSKLSPLFYRIAVEVACSRTSTTYATEKHGLASGQTGGGDSILVQKYCRYFRSLDTHGSRDHRPRRYWSYFQLVRQG